MRLKETLNLYEMDVGENTSHLDKVFLSQLGTLPFKGPVKTGIFYSFYNVTSEVSSTRH